MRPACVCGGMPAWLNKSANTRNTNETERYLESEAGQSEAPLARQGGKEGGRAGGCEREGGSIGD